jgi:hypothetical protein
MASKAKEIRQITSFGEIRIMSPAQHQRSMSKEGQGKDTVFLMEFLAQGG